MDEPLTLDSHNGRSGCVRRRTDEGPCFGRNCLRFGARVRRAYRIPLCIRRSQIMSVRTTFIIEKTATETTARKVSGVTSARCDIAAQP